MFNALTLFALSTFALAGVHAETHTIHFDNRCNTGTVRFSHLSLFFFPVLTMFLVPVQPVLEQNFVTLNPDGGDYTSDGPLISAIAYISLLYLPLIELFINTLFSLTLL